MVNRRRENDTALTSALPAPRRIAWWVWSGVGTAALLALLTLAGKGHEAWKGGDWVWGISGWLAQVCGGLGQVFDPDGGLILGQRLGFLAVALLVLYLYWRATRAFLAYKPGPVDVQELIDATPPKSLPHSATDLTAELRQQLSDCSMYAPTTLPAESPPMSFLELVGDVELGAKSLGSAIPRLLSRLRPKLAYRVGGVLRIREQEPDRLGMTVTVTAYVFGGSRSTTLWGNDWDEVIRKVGRWVISTLLPVTRAGRQPPWRRWWGRELSPELYGAYQNANELSRAGRYHEALSRYYDAIALDPENPHLRSELAEVQEKMGLHIDALETCQRALTLDGQTTGQYAKRVWLRPWKPSWRRLRYLFHPHRYREVLGLRYRNAVILGTSEETTKQWFDTGEVRDDGTRGRLAGLIANRYWRAAIGLVPSGTEEKWLTCALKPHPDRTTDASSLDEDLVRLVFQRASMQETNRLAADDRWARLAGLYWPARVESVFRLLSPFSSVQSYLGPRQNVTRGAFRINQIVWAPLRLAWSLEHARSHHSVNLDPSQGYHWRTGPSVSTDIAPRELADLINRARSRLVLLRRVLPLCRRSDWLTRYNSACVHAVALKAGSANANDVNREGEEETEQERQRREGRREQYVKFAVEELEQAVLLPRGDFATIERTWMAHEDPDLAYLRKDPLFQRFELTAYPGVEIPAETPPDNWTEAQMRAYDHRLLREAAQVMERVWALRGMESSFDIRVAAEWLQGECLIWDSVKKVTDPNRLGHWEDRVELIAAVRNSHPVLPVTPGFPPSMLSRGMAKDDSRHVQVTLRHLQRDLQGNETHRLRMEEGQESFSRATANGVAWLKPKPVHNLCVGYSAVWQTLAEWLGMDRSEQHFRDALGRVPEPSTDGLTQQGDPGPTA
ncbi:tetratricopeptide repeat protein [Streptomyces sp. NPDC005953]|uniref:tetratricopeptide repeat protein n=1 Tax=Streptomyces sp. NPDC005953 TaxID=3156719 RepID=UPI0033FB8B0B